MVYSLILACLTTLHIDNIQPCSFHTIDRLSVAGVGIQATIPPGRMHETLTLSSSVFCLIVNSCHTINDDVPR